MLVFGLLWVVDLSFGWVVGLSGCCGLLGCWVVQLLGCSVVGLSFLGYC